MHQCDTARLFHELFDAEEGTGMTQKLSIHWEI